MDPGYGVRPPAYNGWRGAYWGYHQGWANGYWHGYHDNNNWGWGSFALGAATGVSAWALGSSFYNWGYASYANPYYAAETVAQPIVIEQTVAGGEPQTVTVPAYTYDYSQPIDTQSAPPPEEVANPAVAKFDSARAAFGTGDYAGALQLTDEALKVLQNDATLHEFRALVLFAVGKYDLAAGPLYAVLSVGPGWDWTTMAGLYPNIDVYTSQLRKLEAFVSANPTSTAGRFVLAYHYLTQGHTEAAVSQLKQVVALAPQDTLSAQLVKQFSPPAESSGTPAPSTAPDPAGDTRQAGESGRKLDCPPGRRHDDRPAHRGRRELHLEGHRQGQAQATRREMVTHRQPAHAGSGRRRRSIGRPCLLASRRQVELPRHRDGCRGSGVALHPLNAGASELEENSADPILVGILSGPGDRACFLSEFPESPVCFDSVMMYPRSVRLVGIHQFLVILEIRHRCY